jgi:hypothetical protein
MMNKLLLSLSKDATRETVLMEQHGATPLAEEINETREAMLSKLRAIGKSGSLETIIAAEKILVEKDLADHTNSPKMASSLKSAKEALETIENHINMVGKPTKYQTVNETNQLQKMRDSRDLPKDGARLAFRAHDTRLGNLDTARLDDHEKVIIQARQHNIRIAEKIYIDRQEKALGRESGKPHMNKKPKPKDEPDLER